MNAFDPLRPNPIQEEVTEHEIGLLGSMLIAPEMISRIETMIDPEDFRDAGHGKLFQAFMTLHTAGKPILQNYKLLSSELKRMNAANDEICSAGYLAKLMQSVAHAGHIVYHAEEVKFAAHKRRMATLAISLMNLSYERESDERQDLATIERKIATLGETKEASAKDVGTIAVELVNEIEEKSKLTVERKLGIFTGLSSHDSSTGPLMPGELCILAARPGCGKTALAMQWAKHVASRKRRTLFISLEMKDRELVGRMLSPMAGVSSAVIRGQSASEGEIELLRIAAEQLRDMPLIVWDQPRANIGRIKGVAKYVIATGGLDALFVDYLGLIRSEGKHFVPRHEQIAQITGELKVTAKELQVPIVCLCQLNREADGNAPKLSNLRESGSIEQDADMVLFIHHTSQPSDYTKEATLIVAKNRHGAIGQSKVFWIPEETTFKESAEWTG